MDVSVEMTGLDSVLAKLKEVDYDAQRRGGRFALRKAANVVRDTVIERAKQLDDPSTEEEIAKNVAIRWSGKQFRATGDLAFRVGILGGAKQYANTKHNVRKRRVGKTYAVGGDKANPGGDTFYWRFLEFGTEKMPARPFMRTALSENVAKATQAFVAEYGKALDRAIKRAKK